MHGRSISSRTSPVTRARPIGATRGQSLVRWARTSWQCTVKSRFNDWCFLAFHGFHTVLASLMLSTYWYFVGDEPYGNPSCYVHSPTLLRVRPGGRRAPELHSFEGKPRNGDGLGLPQVESPNSDSKHHDVIDNLCEVVGRFSRKGLLPSRDKVRDCIAKHIAHIVFRSITQSPPPSREWAKFHAILPDGDSDSSICDTQPLLQCSLDLRGSQHWEQSRPDIFHFDPLQTQFWRAINMFQNGCSELSEIWFRLMDNPLFARCWTGLFGARGSTRCFYPLLFF